MEALDNLLDAFKAEIHKQLTEEIASAEAEARKLRDMLSCPEGYTTIEGAAKYLGRTPMAVRNMIKRRTLPFYKLDGRVQFKYTELDDYMRRGRIASYAEQ